MVSHDPSPEDLLHGSAPKSKSPGGIFSIISLNHSRPDIPKTFATSRSSSSNEPRRGGAICAFLGLFISRWKLNLIDRGVGVFEKVFRFYRHTSSPRAWAEWMDYYDGLYQSKTPDPIYFRRLLIRNGLPDQQNPYSVQSEEYYAFHPMGFVFIEFEVLLSFLLSVKPAEEDLGPDLEWMTVEASVSRQAQDGIKLKKMNYEMALVSWAFILLESSTLGRIRELVHSENLELITVELLKSLEGKKWGVDLAKVERRALGLEVISHPWIPVLHRTSKEDLTPPWVEKSKNSNPPPKLNWGLRRKEKADSSS